MKKIIFPILAFSSVILFSCDKDNDPPAPSKTEHITSSSWKFDKATAGGFDVSSQVPACYKDNVVTFQANGNGTIAEGAVICAPPTPPTFTWSFQTNETVLALSTPLFAGGTGNFNIVTLNQTNLVVAQDMNIPPVGNTNVVVTFKH